jgi:hypothetical protein
VSPGCACTVVLSRWITGRSVVGIVTDLPEAGHVVEQKDGRRNRIRFSAHLPSPEPAGRERGISDVLAVLSTDTGGGGTRE